MQIKKEEVRQALIDQAVIEFKTHGFQGASIRRISKNAGTTIGNFYNYFESKENLYSEIVSEIHLKVLHMAGHHNESPEINALWEKQDVNLWRRELTKMIGSVMPLISDPLIILLESSDGTSFEGIRDDLADILAGHYLEHVAHFAPEYPCPEMGVILAHQVIDGVLEIFKRFHDTETRQRILVEQILFFVIGTMGLLLPE